MDREALRANGTVVGLAGLVLSAAFMAGVHLFGGGQVDAVGSTLSALVFVDGYGWMFGASVVGMGLGALGLLALCADRNARWLLGLTGLCCLLVAVFPTNKSGPMTVSAEIHRYAAGVAFFAVPVIAVLVARALRPGAARAWLLGSTAVSGAILLVFLASNFGLAPQEVQDMRGVFQRLMFVVQLAVLAQMILAARLAARPSARLVRLPVQRTPVPAQAALPERVAVPA